VTCGGGSPYVPVPEAAFGRQSHRALTGDTLAPAIDWHSVADAFRVTDIGYRCYNGDTAPSNKPQEVTPSHSIRVISEYGTLEADVGAFRLRRQPTGVGGLRIANSWTALAWVEADRGCGEQSQSQGEGILGGDMVFQIASAGTVDELLLGLSFARLVCLKGGLR
jgi:hypothetical protein